MSQPPARPRGAQDEERCASPSTRDYGVEYLQVNLVEAQPSLSSPPPPDTGSPIPTDLICEMRPTASFGWRGDSGTARVIPQINRTEHRAQSTEHRAQRIMSTCEAPSTQGGPRMQGLKIYLLRLVRRGRGRTLPASLVPFPPLSVALCSPRVGVHLRCSSSRFLDRVFRLSCGWSAREVTTPETQ